MSEFESNLSKLDDVREVSALATDFYQLSMAYGYWKQGLTERESVFNLFFRKNPFGGNYTIFCGLEKALRLVSQFGFSGEELAYLAQLKRPDGEPFFEDAFLRYLESARFEGSLDSVKEGTLVFPNEPLIRLQGPVLQCQLLETALLNVINFESLIATKASRVKWAAGDSAVLEFGLRRAQGIDGGLSASRAAYIGGCDATSNVEAGMHFGIPVKGTHSHSWVMCFDSERQAYEAYAQSMPHNCVFVVDTFDTMKGVRHAIEVGRQLRVAGGDLKGIRLDSGDLVSLSVEARKTLDEAGFEKSAIYASNDLDEYEILRLKNAGATIDIWGVGTRLVTAYDQPALSGVLKMSAVRDSGEDWRYKAKFSEEKGKRSLPGIQNICRVVRDGRYCKDIVYNEERGQLEEGPGLLLPMIIGGERLVPVETTTAIRQRVSQEFSLMPSCIRAFDAMETPYQVDIDDSLINLVEQQ